MRRLVVLPAARADLRSIHRYIAMDNPPVARRFVGELRQQCQGLMLSPFMGRPREDLAPDLRSLPSGNYVIFYSVTDSEVIIERVIHGRRDMKAQFT